MILQNSNVIYNTPYLKQDNIVLDISSRLSLKELYEKISAGEDISSLADFQVYKRVNAPVLFESYRPPFEESELEDTKVTISSFENYLYQKLGYADYFEQIPVDFSGETEGAVSKEQVLAYLAAGLEILPELEDKQSLSLSEKLSLSETAKLFYENNNAISPYNPLPSYEDLVFYTSLSSYEQRLLRDTDRDVTVSSKALDLARYCKDESVNGYGKLFVQETMTEEHFRNSYHFSNAPSVIKATADFNYVLLEKCNCPLSVKLPSRVFQSLTRLLAIRGQLYPDSQGTMRLYNFFANNWSQMPADTLNHLSEAFGTHNTEQVKDIIKAVLKEEGCLLPAERLRQLMSGEGTNTPAALQDAMNEYLEEASTRFLSQGLSTVEDVKQFVQSEVENCYPLPTEPLEEVLRDAFQQEFGRAPKILHDLLRAYQIQHKEDLQQGLTNNHIQDIVGHFKLKNIQSILKYHSHALYNMSRHIDFTSIKSAHLEIFATKNLDVNDLEKKGFFEWYQAHRNVNASELYDLLSCNIAEYSLNKTAKELTKYSRLKSAYDEVERIREAWHINFEDNDIAIPGRDIVVRDGKWTIEICDKDDPRQAYSGYDTNCCQHLGGAGQTCVQDILTNPLSGNLIITDNQTGQIVAQSYIWSDLSKDALVLDNMEFERSHDATARKFFPLVAKWCEQMPHKNIQIGTGYCQSFKGIGAPVTTYTGCHRTVLGPVEHCYSDYHVTGTNAARVLKQDGTVLFKISDMAKVSRKELKSSVLEDTCGLEDIELFTLSNIRSPQDVIDFKNKAANPTEENEAWVRQQITTILQKKKFNLIRLFANIPEDLQERIFNTDASSVLLIQNPADSVLQKFLTLNPGAITKFPNLNPNIVRHLYAQNGLLVRKAPTTNPDCQRDAVKSEPLAVIYLKDSPIFKELLMLAIQKEPSIIKFFPDAEDEFWNKAIYRDPFLIKYKKFPTKWQKDTAIKKLPSVVYSIKNATQADFDLAKSFLRANRTSPQPRQNQAESQSNYTQQTFRR